MGRQVLLIILIITIFLLAIFKIRNYDIWWHLKAGEVIVTTLNIPYQDIFSHTAKTHIWINHEWLSQVIFFIIFKLSGINGLILFKACLITIAFILLIRISLLKGADIYSICIIILLGVLVARFRFFVRPEIFSLLLITIYLYIFYQRKYLFLIPILMLVWVNLHPGFIFGQLLVFLYFLNEVRNSNIRYPLIIMLVSFGVSFINPYTYHLHECIIDFKKLLSIYPISEYHKPDFYNYSLFFSMLGLTFVVVVINWRKIELFELLCVLCFGFLSINANRCILVFVLSSIPILAKHLKLFPSEIKVIIYLKYLILILIIIFILVGSICGKYNWFFMNRCGSSTLPKFGLGIEERIYPMGAVEFIQQNKIHGKMYNSHPLGGFLIYKLYPNQEVFFDGRNSVYEELIRNFWTKTGWSKLNNLFDTYSIDYAIVGYSDIEILDYLNTALNWKLVYFDDICCLYLKCIPKYKDIIARYNYQYLCPDINYLTKYLKAQDEIKYRVEEEIKRGIKINPASFRAHFLLGDWYHRLGKLNYAIEEYKKAIALYPQSPELHNNLGIAYAQKGKKHEATKEFNQALSLDRNFKPAKENLKKVKK